MTSYSVITICLNCSNTISRTIDSVMSQELLPKQYIFVLGCSEDESYNVILSYKDFIERLDVEFILIEENKTSRAGIPVAWNLGIEAIKSDVVAILNADDFYSSNNLMSNVVAHFNDNSECLIVSGNIQYTNNSTIIKNRLQQLFPFLNPYNHPATFIAKKLYDKIGFYNTSYIVSADYEFIYRAFSLGYNFLRDDKIIVSMSPGGFASKNKKIGRYEAYKIASNHSRFNILPAIAFILRLILRK